MLDPLPIEILLPSPRNITPYQMEAFCFTVTSPITAAFDAIKLFGLRFGYLPGSL